MSQPAPPPVTLELAWQGGMRFEGHSAQTAMVLDGAGTAGPSPVQALAFALAGCMAIDVVHILSKSRLGLEALRATLVGERRSEDPKWFTRITLHFEVTGEVPTAAVERALSLSREKYCSVWHSLRRDIEFRTTCEISKATPA